METKQRKSNRRGILTERKLKFVAFYEGNQTEAAKLAGSKSPSKDGSLYMDDPLVREAILKKQAAATQEAGRKQTEGMGITRSKVIERLWNLANLNPEVTNNTINGQVSAGKELAEILGMKVTRNLDLNKLFEGRSDEDIEFFAVHGHFPVDAR